MLSDSSNLQHLKSQGSPTASLLCPSSHPAHAAPCRGEPVSPATRLPLAAHGGLAGCQRGGRLGNLFPLLLVTTPGAVRQWESMKVRGGCGLSDGGDLLYLLPACRGGSSRRFPWDTRGPLPRCCRQRLSLRPPGSCSPVKEGGKCPHAPSPVPFHRQEAWCKSWARSFTSTCKASEALAAPGASLGSRTSAPCFAPAAPTRAPACPGANVSRSPGSTEPALQSSSPR